MSQSQLADLESRRPELEAERDTRQDALATARQRAKAAQLAARDLIIRSESRRSQEASMATGLARMADQREQLSRRCAELEVN